MIRVYDEAGNVIETHKHAGDFKECVVVRCNKQTIFGGHPNADPFAPRRPMPVRRLPTRPQ